MNTGKEEHICNCDTCNSLRKMFAVRPRIRQKITTVEIMVDHVTGEVAYCMICYTNDGKLIIINDEWDILAEFPEDVPTAALMGYLAGMRPDLR